MMTLRSYIFILLSIIVQNKINSCPSSCICEHKTLECTGQNLTDIPENIPHNITSLMLDENMIDNLQTLHAIRLPSVTTISLFKNHLSEVKSFDGIPNLHYFNVAENRLRIFEIETVMHLKSLFYVNLTNNDIVNVKFGKKPVDFEIDLSGNPINCTCQFINDYKGKMIKNMHGKCKYPAGLENITFSEAYWYSECNKRPPMSAVYHSPLKETFSTNTSMLPVTTAPISSEVAHYIRRIYVVSSLIFICVVIS